MKINIFNYKPIIKNNIVEKFKFYYLIEENKGETANIIELPCETQKELLQWSEEEILQLFFNWMDNNYDTIKTQLLEHRKWLGKENII